MDATSGATRPPQVGSEPGELTAELHLEVPPVPTDLHDPRQRTAVEQALTDVPGLVGARIVAGFDRQVDEVHVLTTLNRSPKQTVRDVQTVLMARFGISTDHRVISVVQLEEGRGLPSTSRVVIERVAIAQTGLTVAAEVVLLDDGHVHRATCEGAGTDRGRTRAVAQATLDAVRGLLDDPAVIIELEGVDVVAVGGRSVAVSALQRRTPRGEEVLGGSAVVRDAVPEAVARSVLDAMNRTIQQPRE